MNTHRRIIFVEHRLAISLRDASGKEPAASLVMASLQATIRGLALFNPDLKDCLERANKLLFRCTDESTMEDFGKDKLQSIVQRAEGESAAALNERILAAVNSLVDEASQVDDMPIMVLQHHRAGGGNR